MIDTKIIDQFVTAVTRVLPEGPKGFEKSLRAAMQGVFDRMNLVSREELEVQEQVLQRTRARPVRRVATLPQRAACVPPPNAG